MIMELTESEVKEIIADCIREHATIDSIEMPTEKSGVLAVTLCGGLFLSELTDIAEKFGDDEILLEAIMDKICLYIIPGPQKH